MDSDRGLLRLLIGVAVLSLATFAVAANAGWQRMEGIDGACTRVFEQDKTAFRGYHWEWLPPAWVCEFDMRDGSHVERRLPFGER
jgi:hypothetical protein